MKRSKVWIVTCFMLLVCSCHQTSEDDQSGEPVVRAGEYSLYKSDLRSALPVGVMVRTVCSLQKSIFVHGLKIC